VGSHIKSVCPCTDLIAIKGSLMYDKYLREEVRTIGIGEYKNDPITENALRRQLEYHERLYH